jgi:hypothetical protein
MESPTWENPFAVEGESVQCYGPTVLCVFLKPGEFLTEAISSTPRKGKFFN